jgi:hypothetical protein
MIVSFKMNLMIPRTHGQSFFTLRYWWSKLKQIDFDKT